MNNFKTIYKTRHKGMKKADNRQNITRNRNQNQDRDMKNKYIIT